MYGVREAGDGFRLLSVVKGLRQKKVFEENIRDT